jgi:hypothetical protein
MPQPGPDTSETARILRFERRTARFGPMPRPAASLRVPSVERSPVQDFSKYEGSPAEPDDYRHRQVTNLAAFVACVLLVAAGVWIATTMANVQRDQNCVLTGGKNCAQISITGQAR